MKNLFIFGFAFLLFTSCDKKDTQYTRQSTEIETFKLVIKDYVNQDWEALISHYSDTAKIYNNATRLHPQTPVELISQNIEDATYFSSWDYLDSESDYEMVVTDKGETWVNFWGLWQGRLKANEKLYEIPAHITARFVDGKIVREHGYWDISELMLDLQQLEKEASTATDTSAVE